MSPIVLIPGMLFVLGLLLAVSAFRPEHVRLDDALASLGDVRPVEVRTGEVPREERLGTWWLQRRPTTVTPAMARALELKGRTVARHFSIKVLFALVGLLLPLLLSVLAAVTGQDVVLPMLVSLVGAVLGFVLPDVLLRTQTKDLAADATESLLTFFDLVTLERMANQSATQSLHAAAGLSDNAIFAQIRGALGRARLEQHLPYTELKALGKRLELPALVDLADVMRLDETGAALSNTLRARVKELRDAHLTAMKVAANRVSERMTIFMVLPSLIFGLIFLTPPILRLISG